MLHSTIKIYDSIVVLTRKLLILGSMLVES